LAYLGTRAPSRRFLFSLAHLDLPVRLQRIFGLAQQFVVDVATRAINPNECRFTFSCEICGLAGGVRVARGFASCSNLIDLALSCVCKDQA
jgi:hypothetical protein